MAGKEVRDLVANFLANAAKSTNTHVTKGTEARKTHQIHGGKNHGINH